MDGPMKPGIPRSSAGSDWRPWPDAAHSNDSLGW